MTDIFDFDQIINREGTASFKYDARQALFGRDDVIPMWVADMDFAAPPAVTRALTERAKHPTYGYTDFPDSMFDALINWFKRRHGWNIKREWIVMCPGVVPTLHAATMAFAEPGGNVIVQPPVYHPFFSSITNTGRQLALNPLQLVNGHYSIDFDHLEQCAANARMLFLCSPHNPVGRVWSPDELKQLLLIAQKHDLVIFSDEIHADLIYPEHKHHVLSTLSGPADNVITAVAPSKTFNIPGLGLSALIAPDATHRTAINKAFNTMHVSAANPFSIVAFEAAYNEGEAWLEALLAYLAKTRDFVADYLAQHLPQIKLVTPEGTYLLWLDCRAFGMSDRELKHFFIHKAGLGLSPGALFGVAGGGFMRMNIGAPKQVIATALNQIKEALN
ncbi:MAG: MalY/PatB family protein [Methylophilaceae bacterium]